MNALPHAMFYSEYFDGEPGNLNWWATSSPMSGRSAVEDFTLHFRIQAACNGYDATLFDEGGAGYWQWNSDLAVGFVDNPDTDTTDGQQVIFNKGLAYAYLLTLPLRLALVYGKDYYPGSVWPGAYGLKSLIDNLCWISHTFAIGAYDVRWVDRDVHVASRDGDGGDLGYSGGLLTAINLNTITPRTITCSTPFGANRWLHDYSGHHADIWTDQNGDATFTIPSNAYSAGQSYLCFAPGGVTQPFSHHARTTLQTFIAAADLDVMPATDNAQTLPQRIHCGRNTKVEVSLSASLPANAALVATVVQADGTSVAMQRIGTRAQSSSSKTTSAGWCTISVEGMGLGSSDLDYELAVTYSG